MSSGGPGSGAVWALVLEGFLLVFPEEGKDALRGFHLGLLGASLLEPFPLSVVGGEREGNWERSVCLLGVT